MRHITVTLWMVVFSLLVSNVVFAQVEIIDGSDAETMKALFPNLDDNTLQLLDNLRQQRLAHEARCVDDPNRQDVWLFWYMNADSAEEAVAQLDVKKKMADEAVVRTGVKVLEKKPSHQSMMDKGIAVQGGKGFYASFTDVYIMPTDSRLESLRLLEKEGFKVTIQNRRECP